LECSLAVDWAQLGDWVYVWTHPAKRPPTPSSINRGLLIFPHHQGRRDAVVQLIQVVFSPNKTFMRRENRIVLSVILLALAAMACSLLSPGGQSSTPTTAQPGLHTPPPTQPAAAAPTATAEPTSPPAARRHYRRPAQSHRAATHSFAAAFPNLAGGVGSSEPVLPVSRFQWLDWNAIPAGVHRARPAGLTDEEFYRRPG